MSLRPQFIPNFLLLSSPYGICYYFSSSLSLLFLILLPFVLVYICLYLLLVLYYTWLTFTDSTWNPFWSRLTEYHWIMSSLSFYYIDFPNQNTEWSSADWLELKLENISEYWLQSRFNREYWIANLCFWDGPWEVLNTYIYCSQTSPTFVWIFILPCSYVKLSHINIYQCHRCQWFS